MTLADRTRRLFHSGHMWVLLLPGIGTASVLMAKPRAIVAHGAESVEVNLGAAEQKVIRAARDRWNAAVFAHDLDALGKLFTPNVHVANGASSSNGLEDAIGEFRWLFENRPDMKYERNPTRIEGHDGWPLAYEIGTWVERWTNKEDGRMTDLRGEYMIMWRKVGGAWLTDAEVYVPATCAGSSYCKPRPPR